MLMGMLWCSFLSELEIFILSFNSVSVNMLFGLVLSSYFSFASPKERVSKRKGDFFAAAPPAKKWLYAVNAVRVSATCAEIIAAVGDY